MVRNRVPSLGEIAGLSRDDWQDLCTGICISLWGTHRVEDSRGKGNGLDAWREMNRQIHGWQFRRLNERFGDHQARTLRSNIELSVSRATSEMGLPLRRFTFVVNIDPEPGHKNSKGEIERLQEICNWAESSHKIDFRFKGVSWVRDRLLQMPYLKPEMFEDITAMMTELREALRNATNSGSIAGQMSDAMSAANAQNQALLARLLQEARSHFERGNEFQRQEEYTKSLVSLDDAWRLIELHPSSEELKARIRILQAGVCQISGLLDRSLQHAKEALILTEAPEARSMRPTATGNFGFISTILQHYELAEEHLLSALDQFEEQANLEETVRTLTHITALYAHQRMFTEAMSWSKRLTAAAKRLEEFTGPSELTFSALGETAALMTTCGENIEGREGFLLLTAALKMHDHLAQVAKKEGWMNQFVKAVSGRAHALWFLERQNEAITDYSIAIDTSNNRFWKIHADGLYNRGHIYLELRQIEQARIDLLQAKSVYIRIGDTASSHDVDRVLSML